MKPIRLNTTYPQIWGDLAFQNRWLRMASALTLLTAILALTVAAVSLRRNPIIIALDRNASVVSQTDDLPTEAKVEQAARRYVGFRYGWSSDALTKSMAKSKPFVAAQSYAAFDKNAVNLGAFAKGKSVSQRIYPTSVTVDTAKNRVQVVGDRFTEIQGLKAATVLRVALTYQTGPLTIENPWGIYFVKEEEAQ